MVRSCLVVAALLAVAGSAHAGERVHSYAYVTGVTTDYETAADEGVRGNHCDITARLPRSVIKDRPPIDDRSSLADAATVEERVDDPNRNCERYVHTWQPVDFDPAHRSEVHFDWPVGDMDRGSAAIGFIVLCAFLFVAGEPVMYRWRLRRRPNRRYKD